METYVIALKRDCSDFVPENWKKELENVDGLKILNDKNLSAIRVEGPIGIGDELEQKFGKFCNIEKLIFHHPL